jgi:crotonobetainyl-CoA:carnitine CoA-transferase CaiB-like acyl-CoA transferase
MVIRLTGNCPMIANQVDRPLAGFTVIDLVASPLAGITRGLLELGAKVIRVEIGGRGAPITVPGYEREGLAYTTANIGKEVVKLAAPDQEFGRLLGLADLIVEDLTSDLAAGFGIDWAGLSRDHPALVRMTVSGFGTGNSFSDWQWSDPVLHALSTELSRSGIMDRSPLLPPGEIALQCAVAQGTYVAAAALYNAIVTQVGDHVDYSALDGALQALDPGYGIGGSATHGRPARLLSPQRPVKGYQYPILKAADGLVRICLLAPRQWQGMFRMMGEPPEFADERYQEIGFRYKSPTLLPAIARFFADKTCADIEAMGQAHGVPIASVLSLHDCLGADHVREREVFVDVALDNGTVAPFPNGLLTIDGVRMGPLQPSPEATPRPAPTGSLDSERPLQGLKVLDLGVIVVGAETGRLLADLGAEVIKVESQAFPDGSRQTYLKIGVSHGFGAGHRNKRSLGLNLRSDEGKALFVQLVAQADVVLSNFKPGTMESLGFGFEDLSAINPRLICVESSAFGSTGPWAKRMGYGPLVRAAAGMTRKWCYPDDADGFSDSITIYPDHVCGRIGATAVLALLLRRMRTGQGGLAEISQAEVMLNHLATEIAGTALGLPDIEQAPDAPWGVFQAAGDDQWCVVTVRDDHDWQKLASVIDDPVFKNPAAATRPGRQALRAELDARLGQWIACQDAETVAATLQRAGIPAARMLRVPEQPDYPYFAERGLFRVDHDDLLPDPLVIERRPAIWNTIPDADNRPAPLMGQDTFDVVREWLGLEDAEIDRLAAEGVLEPVSQKIRSLIADGSYKEAAQ